jgi:hypothetical protein
MFRRRRRRGREG